MRRRMPSASLPELFVDQEARRAMFVDVAVGLATGTSGGHVLMIYVHFSCCSSSKSAGSSEMSVGGTF